MKHKVYLLRISADLSSLVFTHMQIFPQKQVKQTHNFCFPSSWIFGYWTAAKSKKGRKARNWWSIVFFHACLWRSTEIASYCFCTKYYLHQQTNKQTNKPISAWNVACSCFKTLKFNFRKTIWLSSVFYIQSGVTWGHFHEFFLFFFDLLSHKSSDYLKLVWVGCDERPNSTKSAQELFQIVNCKGTLSSF